MFHCDLVQAISLVVLPESRNSEFVRQRGLGQDKLDPTEIKRMGGEIRELGRIANNATKQEIEEQLKTMVGPWWDKRVLRLCEKSQNLLIRGTVNRT